MDGVSAREILAWRYQPPYDIYNANPDETDAFVQALLDPANAYHAITDEGVMYCKHFQKE
jgi:hypothetical protein